ncbi:hypothetical protein [Streptomyces sp. SAS_276]|uniref:hypothetical protein n=1 Tax=Streptomyces sp. SAS_276 TaxID=3412745 RepID=UPI00403C8499
MTVFSLTGGAIPATLLRMIGELTPAGGSAPATMGLIQQLSDLQRKTDGKPIGYRFNVGGFLGPTVAAWLATRTGDWPSTWWLTCACTAAGIALGLRPRARVPVRVATPASSR